jgi:hypothetical protein
VTPREPLARNPLDELVQDLCDGVLVVYDAVKGQHDLVTIAPEDGDRHRGAVALGRLSGGSWVSSKNWLISSRCLLVTILTGIVLLSFAGALFPGASFSTPARPARR